MRFDKIAVAVLAGAALLTACEGEVAGPALQLDATTTANIVVRVQTDGSLTITPAFVNDPAGATRLNRYRKGDTTLFSSLTTPGTTAPVAQRGVVRFNGLLPGQYVIRSSLRAFSSASSTASISAQTGDSIALTVAAGQTDTSGIMRVRLGAAVAGSLTVSWTDSTKINTVRLANTRLVFQRETAPASAVYANVDSTTTDATGAYTLTVPVNPTPGLGSVTTKVRINFTTSTAGLTTPLPDQAQFYLGGFATPQTLNPGLNVAATMPQSGVGFAGPIPNQTFTQNLAFTFPSQIQGRIYRDVNNNGVFDSTATGAADERMQPGDTVVVQLRNADITAAGTRTISTSRLTPATAQAPTFTFSSIRQGNYRIWIDVTLSRFAGARPLSSPKMVFTLPTSSFRFVTVGAPGTGIDVGVPVP